MRRVDDAGGDAGRYARRKPPSSSNVITIQGMAFSPLRLEVTPGATVTVRNLDAEVHSVTSQSTRGAFRLGRGERRLVRHRHLHR